MEKQLHLYRQFTYLFVHSSKILNFAINPPLISLTLAQNIFHPQGGGQPSDKGTISINNQQFIVKNILYDRQQDVVSLQFDENEELKGLIQNNQNEVVQNIDQNFRTINARLHSAGHLIDIAVRKAGLNWKPGKGYHFADSPYVEYITNGVGNPGQYQSVIQQKIDEIFASQIDSDKSTISYYTQEELLKNLGEEFKSDHKTVRVIKLNSEDLGCPCGGTHVENVKEIAKIVVTKVQKKSKNVRVCYNVEQQ